MIVVHPAGGQRIGADVAAGVIGRQVTCQAQHTGLGHRIENRLVILRLLPGAAVEALVGAHKPVCGANVDDHAVVLGNHRLDGRLGAQEHARQVHIQRLPPGREGIIFKGVGALLPHIVLIKFGVHGGRADQDIQTVVGVGAGFHHGAHRVGVGHIHAHAKRRQALRLQFGSHGFSRGRVEVGHNHTGAGLRQRAAEALAQQPGAARHHCRLPAEFELIKNMSHDCIPHIQS